MKNITLSFLYIALTMSYMACATVDPDKVPFNMADGNFYIRTSSKEFTIAHEKNPNAFQVITCVYKDYTRLLGETVTSLTNRLATDEMKRKEIGNIPRGGLLIVTITSSSLASTKRSNFEFIVFQGGKEVYRQVGSVGPLPRPLDYRSWEDIQIIILDEPIDHELNLYVVPRAFGGRTTFTINRVILPDRDLLGFWIRDDGIVMAVKPGGQADKAGLKGWDRIIKVDDQIIEPGDRNRYAAKLGGAEDTWVTVEVMRDEKPITIKMLRK